MTNQVMAGEDLEAFLASPLPDGFYRTLHCTICGAVTYLRIGGTDIITGDPALHNESHDKSAGARLRKITRAGLTRVRRPRHPHLKDERDKDD